MIEAKIKAALIRLHAGIKNSDGPEISSALNQVEAELVQHREELHPQLVHFLERRSYAKAVMFLGGETDIPVGACGGRPAKG